MNYFLRAGMFGSALLGAHLMRGAAAAALLAWAIVQQTAHPFLSLGAGVAALVALRGCPMCWTVGLVETLSQGRRGSTDERTDRTWLHYSAVGKQGDSCYTRHGRRRPAIHDFSCCQQRSRGWRACPRHDGRRHCRLYFPTSQ